MRERIKESDIERGRNSVGKARAKEVGEVGQTTERKRSELVKVGEVGGVTQNEMNDHKDSQLWFTIIGGIRKKPVQ